MENNVYKNIFLKENYEVIGYTSKKRPIVKIELPKRNRAQHGKMLADKMDKIWQQVNEKRKAVSYATKTGTYIEFDSQPEFSLITKSLEDRRAGIKLLNVKKLKDANNKIVNKATVFIPKEKKIIL